MITESTPIYTVNDAGEPCFPTRMEQGSIVYTADADRFLMTCRLCGKEGR